MFFSIDPNNGISIYEQIVRQVKFAVADVPAALALWLPAYGLASYLSNKSYGTETQQFIDVGLYLLSLAIGCVGL